MFFARKQNKVNVGWILHQRRRQGYLPSKYSDLTVKSCVTTMLFPLFSSRSIESPLESPLESSTIRSSLAQAVVL